MHMTDKPYLFQHNILPYIEELIKTMWSHYGKDVQADILIVGGSALAMKYNLRGTCDIDAEIRTSARMLSQCIIETADRCGIFRDFVNSDFMKSYSYSRYIWNYVIPVKQYNNVRVFVVNDIAQLAMKLVSGRTKDYKDAKFLADICIKHGMRWSDVEQVHRTLYGDSYNTGMKIDLRNTIRRKFRRANLL